MRSSLRTGSATRTTRKLTSGLRGRFRGRQTRMTSALARRGCEDRSTRMSAGRRCGAVRVVGENVQQRFDGAGLVARAALAKAPTKLDGGGASADKPVVLHTGVLDVQPRHEHPVREVMELHKPWWLPLQAAESRHHRRYTILVVDHCDLARLAANLHPCGREHLRDPLPQILQEVPAPMVAFNPLERARRPISDARVRFQ
jgi:hypothetical protein